MTFVATKKGLTTNFFSSLSFVAVFGSGIRDLGSGMGKNQDPGSATHGISLIQVCQETDRDGRANSRWCHFYTGMNNKSLTR